MTQTACFTEISIRTCSIAGSGTTAETNGVGNSFSDFLSGALNSRTASVTPQTPAQTTDSTAQALADRIAKLVHFAQTLMDRLMERLSLSAPDGFEVSENASSKKLEVTGVSADKDALENAVNNDGFFCQTFQAIRIQYTELRSFTLAPENDSAPFSLAFESGKAGLDTSDLPGKLADMLMEAIDKNRAEEEKRAEASDPAKNRV